MAADASTLHRIDATRADLVDWRRDLHANPELGFEEVRTSRLIAERLAAFGCEVVQGIGGTGVVGTLRAGTGQGVIGLRSDMDALPIDERNDFAHRSRASGRMHACGHDGHATMLLGAARHLCETRNFDGTVHFIFQPAEEGLGGARAMLADGLFDRFPCDAIFGIHNRPGLPIGKFALRAGAMMAAGAVFDIRVTGKGAHGARPESGVDAVLVASQLTVALQSIVSRNVPPSEPAVLSVTKIHGGDAYNVIPHTASLGGTVRAFSSDVMRLIEAAMKRVAEGIGQTFGAQVEVDFRLVFAPTVNDAAQAAFAAEVCAELVGPENVDTQWKPLMASEDFSFMLEKVPGCYVLIGNGEGSYRCEVHNPAYDFNDEALPIGASYFARLVERRLARP